MKNQFNQELIQHLLETLATDLGHVQDLRRITGFDLAPDTMKEAFHIFKQEILNSEAFYNDCEDTYKISVYVEFDRQFITELLKAMVQTESLHKKMSVIELARLVSDSVVKKEVFVFNKL